MRCKMPDFLLGRALGGPAARGAGALACGLALAVLAIPQGPLGAQPQRGGAYAAARAAGEVGERMDGYLGIVGTATSPLRALVDDINIRRRAVYAERAQAEGATLEEYAFTAGCLAILRTQAGEMYQAYSTGQWVRRGSAAPDRDPRCP